jgi:DNA-directed RNA polymerase specialized sigma24 family protein
LWPDDYIEWARQSKPELIRVIGEALLALAGPSRGRPTGSDLAREAARRAFVTADSWRRYPSTIVDQQQFRRLIGALGMAEALWLFLDHEYVATQIQQLSSKRRLALLLRYVARLSPADAGPVLGIPLEEVRRATLEGLDGLRSLL